LRKEEGGGEWRRMDEEGRGWRWKKGEGDKEIRGC
jgi:hypothetical protein